MVMRRTGWLTVVATLMVTAPLLIASAAASASPVGKAPASASARQQIVVTVRPGTSLPLELPGARVMDTFSHVHAELVSVSRADIDSLMANHDVLGISPNRNGQVAGWGHGGDDSDSPGVLAPQAVGGDAGSRWAGAGVTVALLDTGVNDTPALNRSSGRLIDGVDTSGLLSGVPAATSGQFTDGYGHGTFLASLIAGGVVPGSHGLGVGVAPAAHVDVVKVADSQGQTSLVSVLAGLDWVATHASSIQVVNLSLAVDPPTAPAYGADPLNAAVEAVRAAGVLVVAAAGNTPDRVADPGMDPKALTVGSVAMTDGRPVVSAFSGSGVVAGVQKPDVVAPGEHVLGEMSPGSVIAQENPQAWDRDGLFRGSGTSEATAITSGAAAAYLSLHPHSTPIAVKTALRASATRLPNPAAGAGMVSLSPQRGYRSFTHHPGITDPTGEASFQPAGWQANSWLDGAWVSWLASSWSASSWSASSWSASSWSASSWSASSWSASSWSASSWSGSSWADAGWG
jgi:serine protease AprX